MATENPEIPPQFAPGSGRFVARRPIEKKQKNKKQPVKINLEDELISSFIGTNPIYAKRCIEKYRMRQQKFDPSNRAAPGEIKMMLSRKPNNEDLYYVALRQIRYFKGTFMEWQIYLQKLGREYVNLHAKSNFKFESNSKIISGFDKRIPAVAQNIFYYNQRYRWFLKRAVTRWIAKKASKRLIGADSDVLTLEPISSADQVKIICTRTRTTYVFSGQTLLKTVLSSLETQIEAIPRPRQPMNPFTNLTFTFGQMNEIYYEILRWCATKRKPVPALLTLYKESGFVTSILYRTNHNYVHYKAGKNQFIRDESDNEFLIENIRDILDAYKEKATPAEYPLLGLFRRNFVRWIEKEKDTYLVKIWRQLVADYWYYKQTEIFPRSTWNSEDAIMCDVKTLLQVCERNVRPRICRRI